MSRATTGVASKFHVVMVGPRTTEVLVEVTVVLLWTTIVLVDVAVAVAMLVKTDVSVTPVVVVFSVKKVESRMLTIEVTVVTSVMVVGSGVSVMTSRSEQSWTAIVP